jgi:ArsR family transcriptional regulator
MPPTTIEMHRLLDGFRALADETRLYVLSLLASGERCQCELKDELGTTQPLLSFHLKALIDAGLIEGRRRGRWMFYSVRRGALAEIESFVKDLGTPASTSGCCGMSEGVEMQSPQRG